MGNQADLTLFLFCCDERDRGQSLLMTTWVCNPTLGLFSSEGEGSEEDHRGRIVYVNRSEWGYPCLTSHLLSLFVLCSF